MMTESGKKRMSRRTVAYLYPAVGGVVLASVFFVAGLLRFINGIDITRPPDPSGDGIVALTGAPGRLPVALELLREGRGTRLLVSGVHPGITPAHLQKALKAEARLFECCIDLDYAAKNTRGNAEESAKWARTHNYRSLIVVTGNYHLPRSLREFRLSMPRTRLTGYPVSEKKVLLSDWWQHPDTARVLVAEYIKYLLTRIRTREHDG